MNYYKGELYTAARQMKIENGEPLEEAVAAFEDLAAWIPTLITRIREEWPTWQEWE